MKKSFTNLIQNKKNFQIKNNQDNLLVNSRWTYKNKFSEKDMPWIAHGIKDSKLYLDKIFNLSQTNKFQISLAVYPWPAQIMFDEDTGRKKFGKVWEEYCFRKCEHYINFLNEFHLLKVQLGNEKLISKFYIKDDVHFNKNGNFFIYQILKKTF